MKKILLGLTLICLVILQSNAQEVVIIKQSGKDSAFKPLIVVDGVITENKEIKDISPSDIKSMNVLKGAGATEKYGQKGENGVIEISTKAKYKTVLDTSNIIVTVNGDEIILNGEKVNANDPRLKKIKRINVIRTPGTPGTPETPGMPAAPPPPINKAFLGVSTKSTENGAQVVEVSPESPAAKAGLKEDDIITKINKEAIDGPAALFEQIGKFKPEDKITVEFLREGKSIKKEVVLAKNKMPAIARALSPMEDLNINLEGLNKDLELYNLDAENFNKRGENFNRNFKRGFILPELPNLEGIDVMSKKPKLGISIEDLEEGHGVKIKTVNSGSPAEKAGLKVGDIITTVDKHEVKEVNDIKWQYFEAGQNIKIGIIRNKENKIIEVKIPKKINSADL